MAADPDPVAAGEFVLRRIPDRLDFIAPAEPVAVAPAAFRPNPNDATGLSVYREGISGVPELLAALPEAKRGGYAFARLAVADLAALGLTVVPEPAAVPGHAVIPELAWDNYCRNKPLLKEVIRRLAELAGAGIAYRPPPG